MVVLFRYLVPQAYTHVPEPKPEFKTVHFLQLDPNLKQVKILDPTQLFIYLDRVLQVHKFLRTHFHPGIRSVILHKNNGLFR